ncbi:hypothetical protein T4B_10271 [Trichinella pseudospiralis]|uniref:Uncharacterized protein n=8 Tax=Trichinella TaxID=6333 RepID=A0A0V1IUA6_TRIPS|nr:hypothetical protein T07_7801 [Trichinella nelsoni]KRX83433.1 hypothetical protein T06_3849 [Trichinella sp. T6]KRX92832.1 hypothetical protein T4E_5038 [Trichinella pseudospiralis]KRY14655.1 hypothetical protein T12_16660 [Trichinella patagoniensis]KRY35234.1 hypothetical protein T01_657 [Trichinella spiralis]KRY55378.1 hypothetical protein T03_12381 [Trichinella britovi]KRZ11836.1 hypothetical protein T11_13496 [Trichinella zimbabwensis]KRZ58971.1 hypothetical protein T02_7862 [Trichine
MRLKRPRWPLRRRGKLCTVFGHFGIPELITAALIDASPFNASLSNCPLAGRLYTACADTAADIN